MKKIISMLLVIAMLITVLAVGVATTSAAETATITIYGVDGTSETKEVNVGDEFTVYSTLDVTASASSGKIASVQGTQTYSSDKLSLVDETSGQYGEFVDLVKVFPVTGENTMANGADVGTISFNASAASTAKAFSFDSAHAQLIVTTYKVTAAGSAEVKTTLRNLAVSDSALTKIIYEGKTQEGKSFSGKAYFEDPTPAIDHAEVRVHSLDGSVETKSFKVGDTFTVYTTLNVSSVNGGKMGSVNGTQKYTSSVLQLNDAVDSDGYITNTSKVFPIMKDETVASAKTAGTIKYAASSTSGFTFNSAKSQLITTTYKVTANGYADITNRLIVLAASDDDITRVVFAGETQSGMSYDMPASFTSDGPSPTDPPEPTDPTPTQKETTASTKLNVTIKNPDNTTVKKSFNVGATFTVYTVLNMGGQAANVDGTQTYPADLLQLTDKVTGEYNEIVDKETVFPVLGDDAVASVNGGVISFNASRAGINKGYAFNSDTSKLIVTNYKVLKAGDATIVTALKTLVKDDSAVTKVVFNGKTQSGQSYKMPGSFTDPGSPEPTQAKPTDPIPTQKETTPSNKANVTIYGLDGKSTTKSFNVGDTFTVYTTFNASKAISNSMIASISASQTYTASVLKSADAVDSLGVVEDVETMFPILGDKTVAKIADGLNRYNASTPNVGKGFKFDSDDSLLLVTKYTVTAVGNAEIRNTLTTVAAADLNLTRIVDKGVIADGYTIGGIASFTDPANPDQPTTATVTYMLGDSDDNGQLEITDATLIQRKIAKLKVKVSDDILLRNGDCDGSGQLEITDATLIQRKIAKLKVKFPVGEFITVEA